MCHVRFSRLIFLNVIFLIVLLATAPSVSASKVITHSDTGKISSLATAPQTQGDWAQFGYDSQHTGTNPFEKTLKPANVGRLQEVWSEADDNFDSSPAVVNGVVYIGSRDNKVYAFNAQTGTLLWSVLTGGPIGSSPAVVNGVVYIGSGDNKVYAFNAQTGTLLWSVLTGGYVDSSPTVANGVVYVGSDDKNMYAFNAQTGTLLWSARPGTGFIDTSPAVANGVVYFDTDRGGGCLYAFNAQTGKQLWSSKKARFGFTSSPVVVNGMVFVASTEENIRAYALLPTG